MATVLAFIGIIFMVAFAGIGSAIGTAKGGSASLAALKKKEEGFGSFLVLSALPGTQGLYGFGAFFLFLNKMSSMTVEMTMFQGAAVLGAGVLMGLAGLFSALHQGTVCANAISAIASGQDAFGKGMILAVFPELYAILAFAASFLISNII